MYISYSKTIEFSGVCLDGLNESFKACPGLFRCRNDLIRRKDESESSSVPQLQSVRVENVFSRKVVISRDSRSDILINNLINNT